MQNNSYNYITILTKLNGWILFVFSFLSSVYPLLWWFWKPNLLHWTELQYVAILLLSHCLNVWVINNLSSSDVLQAHALNADSVSHLTLWEPNLVIIQSLIWILVTDLLIVIQTQRSISFIQTLLSSKGPSHFSIANFTRYRNVNIWDSSVVLRGDKHDSLPSIL